MTKPCFSRI